MSALSRRFGPRVVRFGILLALSASALLVQPAGAAQAQSGAAPATIRMGTFYRTLPMLAAQARGFYAQQNLTVDYQQVTSSTQQFQSLRDDLYDVIQTAPDNVANYRLNSSNPLGATIDVQGFMGMDYGLYLVVTARPGITSIEELRGKTVSVDALASGFAYVLYKILQRHGLQRDVDYSVVSTGGVANRYTALLDGQFDATLLSGGFETRAANTGYMLLDSVYDIASPYLGAVGAAKTAWLRQNRDVATRLIRAYYDASRWAFDPANREEAIGLLETLPNTPRALAEQLYDVQVRPGVGSVPDAGIERQAIFNVLALRAEFGGFDRPQNLEQLAGPDSGLYDLSYYRAALASPVAPAAPGAVAPTPPASAAPRPAAAPAQLPRTGDLPLPFIPAAAVGLAFLVGGLIRRRCS